MPATTGMKGAGYYDQNSTAQLATIRALQGWIDDAVADIPLPAPNRPATILDLGSSEGRNAIHVMAAIAERLRRRTRQPLQTIYSDLAGNDFNQLFTNLEEARRAGRFPSGVYASAVGGSFYGPILPPGSVHLAVSFNSLNWLDRLPEVPVPNFVAYRRPHPPRPGLVISAEATAAYQQQSEQDLARFLECRARELVPGGKLLLASPGDTDDVCIGDGLADVVNDACLDLVADGLLERDEYERLMMPLYFRTLAELIAPLERENSPLSGAFTVDRAEALEVPTPFVVEFQRGGDAAAYARAYTGFVRAVSEPVVKATIGQREREAEIVQNLYERIRLRLQAEPERYIFRYIVVAALLTRRQQSRERSTYSGNVCNGSNRLGPHL
jgi:cyclopropane-fatty-acyl-phospholipid synthase